MALLFAITTLIFTIVAYTVGKKIGELKTVLLLEKKVGLENIMNLPKKNENTKRI